MKFSGPAGGRRLYSSPSTRGCGLKSFLSRRHPKLVVVTLHARVWIEITYPTPTMSYKPLSPSTRGCGLKYLASGPPTSRFPSPSTRGCGLKSPYWGLYGMSSMSPSTRGCGLKYQRETIHHGGEAVTLHARVWIEIFVCLLINHLSSCHPPREGVD